jgi:two-component system response regulator YesN
LYKLLVVEDEEVIREGIVSMIDWKSHGIEVCGQASNGVDGYELIEKKSPDILLTDIRMPQMDGLQLIQKAKDDQFEFEAILLSGFNDFEYAKQGIKLGVLDYILKPCRPESILKTVLKAKHSLEQRRKTVHDINQLRQTWRKNVPLVKWQTLTKWVYYPKSPLENRADLLEELQMSLLSQPVHIGIIRFDLSRVGHDNHDDDQELIRFAALNIVNETLAPAYENHLESFRDGDDLLWCANVTPQTTNEELRKYLVFLQSNLEEYLNLSISIGIGTTYEMIDFVHQSYDEANIAIESRFYKGKGGIFFYSELESIKQAKINILNDTEMTALETEILKKLHNGQYAEAIDETENWLAHLQHNSQYTRNEVNLKTTAFIVEMEKLAHEQRVSTPEWKHDIVLWVEQLPHFETMDDIVTFIQKIMQNLVEILRSHSPLHRTIKTVLDIIHQRYDSDLSLNSVAKEVFVSTTYLSSLFKQELGINFLDYLHQYRIEQAKTLLRNNIKVYAVARLVGYQDERHFSNTFKKWAEQTPSQFQRNC